MNKLSNRRFFAEQSKIATEEVMNFEGAEDLAGANYHEANGGAMRVPQSDPFVITLTNTDTVPVIDVTILNAGEQFGNKAGNYGMLPAIFVDYGISGVSYDMFLADLLTTNTLIGKTYIESATTTNLTANLKVEVYDVLGTVTSKSYSPVISPSQYQNGVMIWNHEFMMNKFTKFTIARVEGNSSVKYRFYPVVTGLRKDAKKFSNPQLGVVDL